MDFSNAIPKILFVGKQNSVYASIIRDLSDIEVNIQTTDTGKECLNLASEKKYAAIILDHKIGDSSRFEIAKSLCSNTQTRNIPVLFIATHTIKNKEQEEAYMAGVTDFISVPSSPHALRSKIKLFVDLYDQQQSLFCLNEELEKEKNRADTANLAKSQFLANMSHEIRTPLNGVIGTAELLGNTSLEPHQIKYVDTIIRSGDNLLGLINEILDLSKIEAGEISFTREDTRPEDLVKDVLVSLAPRAREKNIELAAWYENDLPDSFSFDPSRVKQIITNLVGNSIKFVHDGHIIVRASHHISKNKQSILRFEIEDTGIGIPANKQQHIFEKFTQADATINKKYGGTGLGLSICKQLVEKMGGKIGVKSAPKSGASFWFEFPAKIVKMTNKKQQAQLKTIQNQRVLIVDHSCNSTMLLSSFLENWDIYNKSVRSCEKALETVIEAQEKGTPFDTILINDTMPDINADRFAEIIQSNTKLQATRITLMYTSGDTELITNPCFTNALLKPVHSDELLQALINKNNIKKAPSLPAQEKDDFSARILVAEDDPTNQMVIQTMLENLGCHVDLAENGLEALKTLEKEPYDLVFMDCMMPEMDGYAATRRIRKQEKNRNKPRQTIIAMTAHAMADDRNKCLKAGMDDYLTKPVKEKILKDTLSEHIPPIIPPKPAIISLQ